MNWILVQNWISLHFFWIICLLSRLLSGWEGNRNMLIYNSSPPPLLLSITSAACNRLGRFFSGFPTFMAFSGILHFHPNPFPILGFLSLLISELFYFLTMFSLHFEFLNFPLSFGYLIVNNCLFYKLGHFSNSSESSVLSVEGALGMLF